MPRMQDRFASTKAMHQDVMDRGWSVPALNRRVKRARDKRMQETGSKGFAQDQAAALKAAQDWAGVTGRSRRREAGQWGGSMRF